MIIPDPVAWRIDRVDERSRERDDRLDERLKKVEELKLDLLAERMREVREELIWIRRALFSFAFSIAGTAAAVLFFLK